MKRRRVLKTGRMPVFVIAILVIGVVAGVGMNLLFGGNTVKKTEISGLKKDVVKEAVKNDKGVEPGKQNSGKSGKPTFNVSQAMSHIFALSEQIGPRPAGSVKESASADYIVAKLGEYGYTVEDQPFTSMDGFSSRNILVTTAGTREGFTIVTGAHYDSKPDTKGAVDDASGVGVVLELARVFKDVHLEPTLKFIFFGTNKPGGGDLEERLQGSRHYIETLGSMERRETVGMIEVDSVAEGEYLALRTQETGLQRLKNKLDVFAREQNEAPVLLKATSDSDNILFEDVQIPAVWVEWCNSGGKLETDDTYNSVQPGKIEKTGTLIQKFLFDLTSDDLEELKY